MRILFMSPRANESLIINISNNCLSIKYHTRPHNPSKQVPCFVPTGFIVNFSITEIYEAVPTYKKGKDFVPVQPALMSQLIIPT